MRLAWFMLTEITGRVYFAWNENNLFDISMAPLYETSHNYGHTISWIALTIQVK